MSSWVTDQMVEDFLDKMEKQQPANTEIINEIRERLDDLDQRLAEENK